MPGLVISVLAVPVMYFLSRRKLQIAEALGSRALRADAIESITCGWLAFVVIGALVAQRTLAFGMRLVAYDPYVSADRARQMGVELMSLDELMAQADFVTIHVAKSKETMGLVGRDLLAKAKPGIRIINASRGGIVDEEALAEGIRSGQVGGAGSPYRA